MARPTRDQQVKLVVEGLALGMLALDVSAVSGSKATFELSIAPALRTWSYAASFPGLAGHLGANYVWLGIRKSERRRGVVTAAWADGQWLEPYVALEGWSVAECTDLLAAAGVPHDGWVELAQALVTALGEENIRRD